MRALLFTLLALVALLSSPPTARAQSRAQAIADAITELDVDRARKLLEQSDAGSGALAFERARLAIYLGDCDTASAILAAPDFSATPEGTSLAELAKACARATAGSVVMDDRDAGVWIRLQDEEDRVLVPFITDVAVRARAQIEKDLGVAMPRPLRVDLVRDLFSLSAVSGLPVTAAETTGTVAVARWGRVTIISPRATPLGYPWEDTMAHEIAHLALSRATRDHAPLWLQEGLAKREETRWREARPFDAVPSADGVARTALLTGRSVGVDKLGPSIAMLPSPDAAATAFSEVTSFVAFWIRENREPALHLLLADLKGVGGEEPDRALRSVSGYDLSGWILIWQKWLREQPAEPSAEDPHVAVKPGTRVQDIARRVRLGDLLFEQGHGNRAAEQLEPAVKALETEAALRFRWSRALLQGGQASSARSALGTERDVRSVHGGWHALSGRFSSEAGESAAADRAFKLGIAVDPLSEEVACEGQLAAPASKGPAPLPADTRRRALCQSVRRLTQD